MRVVRLPTALRWGVPDVTAPKSAPTDTVERVRGRKVAVTALVGASLALSGCNNPLVESVLAGIRGAAVTESIATYVPPPTVKAKGHADGTALGAQFVLTDATQGQRAVADAYGKTGKIGVMSHGRTFTGDEIVSMRDVADALQPLWGCWKARTFKLARVDVLDDDAAGVAFSSQNLIAFADSSRAENHTFGTVGVFSHELAHAFLTYANPLTCENYDTPEANPLYRKYVDLVKAHEPEAVTVYGGTNYVEDLAEAFRLYMTNRDQLRKDRPYRARFFDDVFKDLKVAPPVELAEYSGTGPALGSFQNWGQDVWWELTLTRDHVPTHITLKKNWTLHITHGAKL